MKPTPSPGSRAGRLLHLDALRGLFLVMMAMDHIPSDIHPVTNHPWGFMSAAEGFVLLAGLMAGFVYTKKLSLATWSAVQRATHSRAGNIYLWHLGGLLVVWCGVRLVMLFTGHVPGGAPELFAQRPIVSLLASATLLYQPGMMDILPLYTGLFLLLPFLLRWLEEGHRRVLWLSSIVVWAATNVWWPQTPITWSGFVYLGAFNFGAWQLIFVTGVIFGHAWARGEALFPRPHAGVLALAAMLAAFLWALRHHYVYLPWPIELQHELANKNNLAPLRLLNVALLAYLGAQVLLRFPQVLRVPSLAFLGQHSIVVFTAHVVVATGINALPHVFATTPAGRFAATMVMLTSLFVAGAVHARLKSGHRGQAPAPIRLSRPVRVGGMRAT